MLIKLILFALLLFVIYKIAGGRLPTLSNRKSDPLSKDEKKIAQDTLVECAKCGTYVTYKESIARGEKIYCSKECLEADKRGER